MKQLKTEIIALCDYANISQEGKININGIFDEFRVEKFPAGFIDKFLVATVKGEPETTYSLNIQLKTMNSDKNLLNPTMVNIVTSKNGKNNLLIRLTTVGFEQEGQYYFIIYNGKQEVGHTLLEVIKLVSEKRGAFSTVN